MYTPFLLLAFVCAVAAVGYGPAARAGCLYRGRRYMEGDALPSTDHCSQCTCRRGRSDCYPIDCPRPTCSQPVHLPGECCPVCPKITCRRRYCPKRHCPNGFALDRQGCETCICRRTPSY